jgi:hypothetical protein
MANGDQARYPPPHRLLSSERVKVITTIVITTIITAIITRIDHTSEKRRCMAETHRFV